VSKEYVGDLTAEAEEEEQLLASRA